MKILRNIYEVMTITLLIVMLVLTIIGITKADGVIPWSFDKEGQPTAHGNELLLLIPIGIALLVNGFITALQRLNRMRDTEVAMRFKGAMAFVKAHTTLILCILNAYLVMGAVRGSMPKGMDAAIIAGFTASLAFGIIMWKMMKKAFS